MELSTIVDKFSGQIAFFEVDVNDSQGLVERLNVKAIPALLGFISGNELICLIGFYCKEEIERRLRSMATDMM